MHHARYAKARTVPRVSGTPPSARCPLALTGRTGAPVSAPALPWPTIRRPRTSHTACSVCCSWVPLHRGAGTSRVRLRRALQRMPPSGQHHAGMAQSEVAPRYCAGGAVAVASWRPGGGSVSSSSARLPTLMGAHVQLTLNATVARFGLWRTGMHRVQGEDLAVRWRRCGCACCSA